MNSFDHDLELELSELRAHGLHRALRRVDSSQSPQLVVDGRALLNFSSNDYLGLATHPALLEAARRAVADFGAGAGASRLICGSQAPHHELELALAGFKATEAAIAFSSGYSAALGAIPTLVGKDDVIILDKLVHASIVDAARLSGAKLRLFRHNDPASLEKVLKWARSRSSNTQSARRSPRLLIVTESVFSMDGDLAPLREIVELKERHGAWLLLDEAHASGLFGEHRRGLAEAQGLAGHVEIQMGTLGKALGAAGGFIAGSRQLVELLVSRARSFIFSTAPVPAAAAAATAAVRLVQSAEGDALRIRLWQRVDELKNELIRAGCSLSPVQSAILPLHVGDERKAMEVATSLRERGIFVPAIRYPSVARGAARLRVTVTAAHTSEHISALGRVLHEIRNA